MQYDLSKYHRVTCEEFQAFFKTAPKTYLVELESLGVNMASIYTYGYCTYDTDEILGIFKGANCLECFSEYYLLNNEGSPRMEAYIEDINEMLFMTYIHGGDNGGPYGVNIDGVKSAVKQFLRHSSLEEQYILGTLTRHYDNAIYPDVPQIVKVVN